MKTNVNSNSIEVYHEVVKDKLEVTQDEIVLNILSKGNPATGRMLSEKTKIVPGQISRVIKSLREDNKILFAYKAPCKVSNKRADYWYFPKPIVNPITNQINLF